MWPFKCKHPFEKLMVRKQETVAGVDEDFEKVIYHFHCVECGKNLELPYARMIGGVKAFFERGMKETGSAN